MPASTFLSVFAKSPIKPIEEHIRKVHQASELLIPFFDAVYQQDWQQAADVRKNIVALEKEADKLKREIRINLPRGLFLPVDRTDILELVSQQDKIANKTKDITGRVLGRELLIPASLQDGFKAYVQRCIDATKLASEVINELDELLETGGGMVKALSQLPDPFFALNADNIWLDGPKNAFHDLSRRWDPEAMDALLLVVPLWAGLAHQALAFLVLGYAVMHAMKMAPR